MNNLIFPSHISTAKHNPAVNNDTMRQLLTVSPNIVYDFGAGDGFYGKLIKHLLPETYVYGIEVENTYKEMFNLTPIYDHLVIEDAVKYITEVEPWTGSRNLAIFRDMLEHLEEYKMKYVLSTAVSKFDYILINSPVGFQEHKHVISSENHRCGIDFNTLKDYTVLEYNVYDIIMFNSLLKGRHVK